MPRLYVLSGDDLGRTFDVQGPSAVLGRVREVDCPVRGASISRRHARLEREPEGWVLVDLESRNGIAKGGVRRARIPLDDGDVFLLGDVEIRFRDDGSAAQPAREEGSASAASPQADELVLHPGGSAAAPEPEQEIELEGEWDPGRAPAPSAPSASAPARSSREDAPPARDTRAARQADARARALGSSAGSPAGSGERATTSGRPILQYQRIERRGGLLDSDLSQQPLVVRLLLGLLVLALGAALVYGAFQLTRTLREDPRAVLEQGG